MLSLATHLFPTATTFLFAAYFAVSPSFETFVSYCIVALLGGLVHASETMATDNVQLVRLKTAVQELEITETDSEDFTDLLPPAGCNYLIRRIAQERRPTACVFFNSSDDMIDHPRAFGFHRFAPICLHSIGTFTGRPRKSMVLYHELGHLFFFQPKGGYIALIFGSAIPLLWIAYADPSMHTAGLIALTAFCLLEFLSIAFLNGYHREVFADGFALASKVTEARDELTEKGIKAVEKRGYFFEEMPDSIRAYEKVVSARGWLRGLWFRRSYERANNFGSLNRIYFSYESRSSGQDLYWKEIFYRRALQGVMVSGRTALAFARLALLIYLVTQLSAVQLFGSTLWVVLACALSVLVILAITATRLDEVSSMVTQAQFRQMTSVLVVEEAVAENRRRAMARKKRDEELRLLGFNDDDEPLSATMSDGKAKRKGMAEN